MTAQRWPASGGSEELSPWPALAVHDLSRAAADPTVETLFFAHPVGFHAHTWVPVVGHLTHRGPMLGVDLPGHGRTPLRRDQPVDWHSLAALVQRAARDGAPEAPIGVGHSMGGALMVIAEIHHPGTFRALWLYEPVIPDSSELPPELAGVERAPGQVRRTEFESLQHAFDHYLGRSSLAQVCDESMWAYVENGFSIRNDGVAVLRCPPDAEQALAAGWIEHRIFDRLDELRCPVHLVHGDPDIYQARWTRAVHAALPESTVEAYPDLTHLGPLERPSAIAGSIEAFLDRLPNDSR